MKYGGTYLADMKSFWAHIIPCRGSYVG